MLYVATFILVSLSIVAMALGVMLGRPGIKGSCGGLAGACTRCTLRCRASRDGRPEDR